MGRHAAGPVLYRDPRTDFYYVRFTHKKQRHCIHAHTRDRGEAEKKKPQIYAEVVSGRQRVARGPASTTPIENVLGEWLEAVESEYAASSYDSVVGHTAKFTEFFVTLGHAADVGMVNDYRRSRLREVKRVTVLKELSGLRKFLAWCKEQGHLAEIPVVEPPAENVTGTPDTKRPHKAKATKITPAEAQAIIERLPEWSKRARRGKVRHRVRDFFVVAWETGLRPVTIGRLATPEHYRRGAAELFLPKEIDKARFERHVPLTQGARDALDRSAGRKGPIFGKHDYREQLVNALELAVKSKAIKKERAAIISIYDFRHGRTTDLASQTTNLAGVAYIVGHRHTSTTSLYIEAPKESAAEVLRGLKGALPKNSGGEVAVGSKRRVAR